MPIPFLLAGLAVGAGALGVTGHSMAKETNAEARSVARKAEELYNSQKELLEFLQKDVEEELTSLGMQKRCVMETSVKRFLDAYDKIKNIELRESTGLDEISNFALDQQEVLQLREISGVYQSAFAGGAAGAAAGTAIALAVSGSLPIVSGTLSLAGTALALGEVGLAGGLAGSALLSGISMTPLAAIAGPAIFVSGISASMKADENLEKAETMRAEAEAAVEKMKASETILKGIEERAEMFDDLLTELNDMFSPCTYLLEETVKNITAREKQKVDIKGLTKRELDLIAVTRSLAGAVKAVIDVPILNKDGNLSKDSEQKYNSIKASLPAFHKSVENIY